ncbi:MAG: SAM-dependent chlorinase/fluorinase [Acetivibrio sp.]
MKKMIIMQSDFGRDSGLVSCMHGMCKLVDKELEIHDITHEIPAFQIKEASYTLQYTVPYWPEGSVFVSVVDPGVGTSRRACVAKLKNGSYVVTPDNGTLTHLKEMIGIEEIREIDENVNRYENTRDISVFHGRDLFSYCAARLASGIISFEEVGKEYPLEEMVLFDLYKAWVENQYVRAYIQGSDPFGSVELSVLNREFIKAGFKLGESLDITIQCEEKLVFHEKVPYEKSFGFVAKGKNLIFNDLASFVTLACNEGNFANRYELDLKKEYEVIIKGV